MPSRWTHCLDLPDALAGLNMEESERGAAASLAMAWTFAFRHALAVKELHTPPRNQNVFRYDEWKEAVRTDADAASRIALAAPADQHPEMMRDLVSAASTFEDAHFSKYLRACLDAYARDESARPIYLSAGTRLASIWISEGRT